MPQNEQNEQTQKRRRAQAGFSLPEIIVVVVILGILAAIVARSLGGSTDKTNATALIRMSQKLTDNWSMIAQTCGTTTDVDASPITTTADNALLLLIGGNGDASSGAFAVPTAYVSCYQQSKVLPLTDSAQWNGSEWRVSGYEPTLAWDDTTGQPTLIVTYDNVPNAIAVATIQHFVPSVTTVNDTFSSPSITIATGTAGTQNITLRRPVN